MKRYEEYRVNASCMDAVISQYALKAGSISIGTIFSWLVEG